MHVVGRPARLVSQLHRRQCDVADFELVGQCIDDLTEAVDVAREQRLPEGAERDLHLLRTEIGHGGDLLDGNRLLRELLDVGELALLARFGKGDRHTLAAGAADAADAMDVRLWRRRHVVVEHVCELIEVESAGGDVGGDEQLGGARAHPAHHSVTLLLAHASVEGFGAVTAAVERLGELVDLGAGAAEHDRGRGHLDIEDPTQSGRLVCPGNDERALPDERLAGLRVAAPDLDPHGIVLMSLGDAVDPRWQGGREQHGLALRRRGPEDLLDVLGEPHVEHLVGFVEHHDLHRLQRKGAAANVVESASGCGHHHVNAAVESLELSPDRLPAVDGQHPGAHVAAVLVHRLRHLHRELAGGHEDERDRSDSGIGVDLLEHGQCEGGCLAGAGRGLAEQIATGEEQRDGLALDRRRLLVSEVGK
ncbi:MAG: hypothetical protein FD127_3632 [Acidimicrobiaceae bacterium]|nr:MAG: hypothetical protein FD127_3632 [Acidimicrobiaceae bacterium]